MVSLKAKPYQVVVQFLLTELRNHLEKSFTVIESKNEMPARMIIRVKWLRNWNPNQMKAHAIFSLNSANAANNVMKSRILIDGTQHEARKLEEDPRRCFKCQIIGAKHTVVTCKAEEACSNCTKNHPTRECNATRAEYQCTTCK